MARGRKPLIGLQLGLIFGFVGLVIAACSDSPRTVDSKDDAGGTIGGSGSKTKDGGKANGACTKNPAFYDIPGDGCDNDGDGVVDNPPTCDETADNDPAVGLARAMGICTNASEKGYGLVAATLTRGFGRTIPAPPEQHSILTKFGNVIVPREGKKLGVLSTGYAQEFDGPDGVDDFTGAGWEPVDDGENGLPNGFPKAAKGCDQGTVTQDVIALHLELKAPKNASGFAFDFDFYTAEWPQFICTDYNDAFIAYLTAKSFHGGVGDNVSFDAKGNPVSVNNGFFDRCTPGIPLACNTPNATTSKCPAGTGELAGTGFGIPENLDLPVCGGYADATRGGATGWLFSQAPIAAEEQFTVDFVIWDTRDGQFDSTILLDNFRWVLGEVAAAPVTDRPPDVK